MNAANAPVVDSAAEQTAHKLRWLVMGVFVFSDTLNFLDRLILAALAPAIKSEFGISNQDYGWILSAFAAVYMLFAPVAGLVVDRFGTTLSMVFGVTIWSLAGAASGIVGSLRGLVASRMVLGMAETVSIPSGSKTMAEYLKPRELGFGIAVNSLGFTLGAVLAPLTAAFFLSRHGWRYAFLFCGCLGLLWVVLWWIVARAIPGKRSPERSPMNLVELLADRRLWSLLLANVFIMTIHTLWFNWTTIFFVETYQMTSVEANRYIAWIPPIFGTLGGFCGGWLGFRWIKGDKDTVAARIRICRVAAPLLLITAAIPLAHSPMVSAAGISASFFLCLVILSNLHVIPIHIFGNGRAAFTASMLAFSYAALQMVFSPIVGAMVDRFGFSAVCVAVAPLPLIGIWLLGRLNSEPTAKRRVMAV